MAKFLHGLKDVYNAEKQLVKAFPKMAKVVQGLLVSVARGPHYSRRGCTLGGNNLPAVLPSPRGFPDSSDTRSS
ncbi:MAG: DUF892 family protein [Planctomycetia bacterium]|nr:DUF892 family protein [Planctomycetia bacterium]